MTIAVDATRTESIRTDTSDPYEFAYTPTSTPRGIVLTISQHGISSTDLVAGVTYGGVAMTRVATAADTAGEFGRTYIYFLGSSVPTGTQTFSIDLTSGATDDFQFVAIGLTGAADTEVVDFDTLSENQLNPSVTLQYGGRTCVAISVLFSGLNTLPPPNANMTHLHDYNVINAWSSVDMQTTPDTADFTVSYTQTSDDCALVAAAFSEVAAGGGLLRALQAHASFSGGPFL